VQVVNACGFDVRVGRQRLRERIDTAPRGLPRGLRLRRLKLRNRRGGHRKPANGSAGEGCGNAASANGDGQNDNASGIHTLHFPHYAATLPPP